MNARSFMMKYGALSTSIMLIDAVTKYAIVQSPGPHELTSWLTLTLSYNRGISWGMFHSDASYQFAAITALIIFFIIGFSLVAFRQYKRGYSIAPEIMVIAGACSNLVDRFLYGGVVDFIIFGYAGWQWPAFNIADACIVIGVIWMILQGEKQ